VLVPEERLVEWFDRRIPAGVCDPESFARWRTEAEGRNPRVLMLELADVLNDAAKVGLNQNAYPDVIDIGDGAAPVSAPLEYSLAPGKDEDGVTATVELTALPLLTAERAAWLVPGMLSEVVLAMMKSLPRAERAALEKAGDLGEVARSCVELMKFDDGPLGAAISEAVSVLHGVHIEPVAWSIKSLPAHLRLRVRVIDHAGKEIAIDRDIAALHDRLAGRLRKAQAAADRSRFERRGLTGWDFGDLPEVVERSEVDGEAVSATAFPALIDEGESARLTLVASAREAGALTWFGVRRLFTLRCREEVGYYLDALPQWAEAVRHFNPLGTTPELRDQLTCVIAERVFIEGQAAVRSKAQFEDRCETNWGRLSAAAREVGEAVAKALEARARVAHRIAGGTPRLWAESVADIREHATYLMPRGFLGCLTWERLRRYPAYAGLMRERLFSLREEGSKSEHEALAKFAPHWKKFTGWVAAAMSAERSGREAEGDHSPTVASAKPGKVKAPLPQARRTGAAVNLEAGEWAMRPGHLTPAVERYRWALEDLRLTIFAPDSAPRPAVTVGDVEKLWLAVGAERLRDGPSTAR
jgi:ATP-dependent helicase HrpA